MLPADKFALEGVTGRLRDPKDSIAHHNLMISMAGLAMFMVLGHGGSSGNRALGDTMADFFYLGLDATADQVAQTLNNTTVRRLVDFNFEGVKKYPRLVCQQILTLKFESIIAALKDLTTAGVVTPDDGLEAWMREKVGAPKKKQETARPIPPMIPGVAGGAAGAAGKISRGTSANGAAGNRGGKRQIRRQ